MTGTLESFELTLGSFGQQYTTIDGVKYATWFDLVDRNLEGLRAGCAVEYEVRPGPTVLCHAPRVTSPLPSARVARVIKKSAEGA